MFLDVVALGSVATQSKQTGETKREGGVRIGVSKLDRERLLLVGDDLLLLVVLGPSADPQSLGYEASARAQDSDRGVERAMARERGNC